MSKYLGQKIRVVTAEIKRDGRYLITQRLPSSTLPLLWEFPGGKVPEGQQPDDVLRRLLREKLGVIAEVGDLVMEVVHEYDHYAVDMQVYRCYIPEEQDLELHKIHDARWVAPSDFANYDFPGADEQTLTSLLELDVRPEGDTTIN